MTNINEKVHALMDICANEPEEIARIIREEPDDEVLGGFVGTMMIFAMFGFADLLVFSCTEEDRKKFPELFEFFEKTRDLRNNEEFADDVLHYIDMLDQVGTLALEYKEATGG